MEESKKGVKVGGAGPIFTHSIVKKLMTVLEGNSSIDVSFLLTILSFNRRSLNDKLFPFLNREAATTENMVELCETIW